jgi:hypothetical protein
MPFAVVTAEDFHERQPIAVNEQVRRGVAAAGATEGDAALYHRVGDTIIFSRNPRLLDSRPAHRKIGSYLRHPYPRTQWFGHLVLLQQSD